MPLFIYKLPFITINQPSILNRTFWDCLNPGFVECCSKSCSDIRVELLHTVKAVTAKLHYKIFLWLITHKELTLCQFLLAKPESLHQAFKCNNNNRKSTPG